METRKVAQILPPNCLFSSQNATGFGYRVHLFPERLNSGAPGRGLELTSHLIELLSHFLDARFHHFAVRLVADDLIGSRVCFPHQFSVGDHIAHLVTEIAFARTVTATRDDEYARNQ